MGNCTEGVFQALRSRSFIFIPRHNGRGIDQVLYFADSNVAMGNNFALRKQQLWHYADYAMAYFKLSRRDRRFGVKTSRCDSYSFCLLLICGLLLSPLLDAKSLNSRSPSAVVTPYTRQVVPAVPARPRPPVEIENAAPTQMIPADADKAMFILKGLNLQGNSVYSSQQLSVFYLDLIDTQVSLELIYQLAWQIQNKYRENGYLLTRVVVPAQTINEGVIQLDIIEGFISSSSIEGDVGGLQNRVQAYLNQLINIKPVNQQQIERYLLLINDLPGVQARSVLRPSKQVSGAAEIVVRVERKRYDGIFVVNNRGSRFTGPWRAMVVGRANSVLDYGEGLEFLFLGTLQNDEQLFGRMVYDQPIGADGLTVNVAASYGPTNPGSSLSILEIETKTLFAGISTRYPLIRSRRENLYIDFGFYATETRVDQLGEKFSEDSLRVFHAGINYDFSDIWHGSNELGLDLRQGADILGASTAGDTDLSRLEGNSVFTALRGYASRYQQIYGPLGIHLAAKGQYSFQTLLSDEEFRVGGEQFGRGYDPSELAGDSGVAVTTELQFNASTAIEAISFYQLYGFYDFGVVWNYDSVIENRASLMSSGLGFRVQMFDYFNVGLEVAFPLTRKVASENNRDPRLYFQISARY